MPEASSAADDEPTQVLPQTARPLEELRPGDPSSIDGYGLLGRIAGHHISEVFLAEMRTGQRLCVIKLAAPEQSADRERFGREAQYLRQVSSRRTAKVVDSGVWQDRPYLVQEFVDGPTLTDVLRKQHGKPCSTGDAYRIARGLAEALHDVHRAGVVHRDVKPSNIIVNETRGVTLVDFGIALGEADPRLTAQHIVMGTPRYMSPEQASGADVGDASDVFGWGAVVGEALLGHHPIEGIDEDRIWALRRCETDPGLDGSPLGKLVRDALQLRPDHRPSIRQILNELDRTERLDTSQETALIPLPERRLRDARSWDEAVGGLRPKFDDALHLLAVRLDVFLAAIAVAVVLGWALGFILGIVASAPWGNG